MNRPRVLADFQMPIACHSAHHPWLAPIRFQTSETRLGLYRLTGPLCFGVTSVIPSFLKDVTDAGLRQKCFLSTGWLSLSA